MTILLLACVATLPTTASAAGASAALVELDVHTQGSGFAADASAPGAIIVACENAQGAYTYGPKDDPRIYVTWSPSDGGFYQIGAADEFLDCRVWVVK